MYKFLSEKVMGHDEHNSRIFADTENWGSFPSSQNPFSRHYQSLSTE